MLVFVLLGFTVRIAYAQIETDKLSSLESQIGVEKLNVVSPLLDSLNLEVNKECVYFLLSAPNAGSKAELLKYISAPNLGKSFAWENDSFYPPDASDRQYTNGMQMRWVNNPCNRDRLHEDRASVKILRSFFPDSEYLINTGGLFGISMFTPDDISGSLRNRTDRPYAGYTYFGFTSVSTKIPRSEASGFEGIDAQHKIDLQVGAIGPVAGQEYAQTFIHEEVTGSTIPLGWDNQISNRATALVDYSYNKDISRLLPWRKNWGANIRPIVRTGFSLGTISNFVKIGGSLVIGRSDNSFPSTPIEPTLHNFSSIRSKRRPFYVYGGFDVRYYINNLLIEGDSESQHDINLVRLVGDAVVGVSVPFVYPLKWFNVDCECNLNYQVVRRTQEFESENEVGGHTFARVELQWGLP